MITKYLSDKTWYAVELDNTISPELNGFKFFLCLYCRIMNVYTVSNVEKTLQKTVRASTFDELLEQG